MRFASPAALAAGVAIGGVFFVRAAIGVPAARAYERGRALEAAGRFAEAGPVLDQAAVGVNRIGALWRGGRARMEAWDSGPVADRLTPGAEDRLRTAAARFLAARAASPASTWFIAVLGDVYGRRETAARARRVADLSALDRGPWGLLGDDGRVAIGLARTAIAREPDRYWYRDQLVLFLEEYGLHEDALRAMADSARALPDFAAHPAFDFDALPRDLVEVFWVTARALAPEDAPILSKERRLLATGQLARRLGHLDEAEADLRAALAAHGTPLGRAEDAFHLSLVLIDLGRDDEALEMLKLAAGEPVFAPGVASCRARLAEKRGRWEEAFTYISELRRLQPQELGVLLDFARIAQKAESFSQAEESLRWAIVLHPGAPAPRRALLHLYLARGEKARARGVLEDYVRLFGRSEESDRMEQAWAGSLDPSGH